VLLFYFSSYEPHSEVTEEMGRHLTVHGDGVKDVSFSVEDLDSIVSRAKAKGAKVVKEIWEESDADGKCRFVS
jgi:4-hydroxyphenylpyruvate dioxygenase